MIKEVTNHVGYDFILVKNSYKYIVIGKDRKGYTLRC